MKSEIPKVWQEAGLETVGPVELDRLFTADTWRVPNSVELKGEALLWDVTKNQTIKVHPGRSMLDDFIRLHNAQPDQILKYAMRWGVLGICKHGLPASHSYPSFVPEPLALQALDSICQPICSKKEPGFSEESLEKWHEFSKKAYELLNIVARLHKGEPSGPEDWTHVHSSFGLPSATQPREELLANDRHKVTYVVQRWLGLGGVRPRFTWDTTSPHFELGGPSIEGFGLFSALAVQLLLVINRIDGLAVCNGCGSPYIPLRRPQTGRRTYCGVCREKGIPMRHAVKDWRIRESKQ